MKSIICGLAFAVAFFTACSPAVPAEAVNIVWYYYKAAGDPPGATWVTQENLTCFRGPEGRFEGWKDPMSAGDLCLAGLTNLDAWESQVARSDDLTWSIHGSALAHELLHAALFREGVPDGDYHHKRPEWQTEMPAAQRLLEEAGY